MNYKVAETLDDLFNEWAKGLFWILSRKDASEMWPIGMTRSTAEFGHHFWSMLRKLKNLCKEQGLSPETLSQKVEHPTSLSSTATYAFFYTRQFSIPLAERTDVLGWLLRIASAAKYGSLFNKDGKHLIYSPSRIQGLIKDDEAIVSNVSEEISQAIHYLSGLLWTYCEVLYFFNHRIGTEKHGPYLSLPRNFNASYALIRSCKNIAPVDLWSNWEELRSVDISRIELVLFYRGQPTTKFDILSNIIHHSDLVNELTAYKLIIHRNHQRVKQPITRSEIDGVISELELMLTVFARRLDSFSESELALKMEHICLFSLLPIATQVGFSWEQLVSDYSPKESPLSSRRFLYGARDLQSEDLANFCNILVDV